MPFTVVEAIDGQGQVVVPVTEVVENTEEALEDLKWEKSRVRVYCKVYKFSLTLTERKMSFCEP